MEPSPSQADRAPRISVVIPTYRRPQLLGRAIRSVLAQAYQALEVHVYDNASGDETAAVVAAVAAQDARVHYHCHAQNIGGLANFRFGMAQVKTPFFCLLSDDDLHLPDFFEQAMRGFVEFPQAMFWGGITIRMTPQGCIFDARSESWPRDGLFLPPEGLFQLMRRGAPIWTGVVIRREALDEVGLLDLAVGGPSDFDYLMRIAARRPYILARKPAAIFMLNPASFSEQEPLSSFWPGWLKMIENIREVHQLDGATQARAIELLDQDARSMLFRRAANAIARRRFDFARQAAAALNDHYGKRIPATLIRLLALLAERSALFQALYSRVYGIAEQAVIRRRKGLQDRYGHLASRLATSADDGARQAQRAAETLA